MFRLIGKWYNCLVVESVQVVDTLGKLFFQEKLDLNLPLLLWWSR